jgi:cell division protein FtsZ
VRQAAAGLTGLARHASWINLDLPLVKDLLAEGGDACLALGLGRGERPAGRAMRAALSSPLSNMSALAHAGRVLVQVSGDRQLCLQDTVEAIEILKERLPAGCEVLAGAAEDPSLVDAAQVMILGVGLAGPARMPASWQRLRAERLALPERLRLDLDRGAYVMEAPLRAATLRRAV